MAESLSLLSMFEECKPVNANALCSTFAVTPSKHCKTCYGCLSQAASVLEFHFMQGLALDKLQRENSRLQTELSRSEYEVQRQKGLRWAINFWVAARAWTESCSYFTYWLVSDRLESNIVLCFSFAHLGCLSASHTSLRQLGFPRFQWCCLSSWPGFAHCRRPGVPTPVPYSLLRDRLRRAQMILIQQLKQVLCRESERQEFNGAKERLKNSWACDRDDFARVKNVLKGKNAEHHAHCGRISHQLKVSASAKSLFKPVALWDQ